MALFFIRHVPALLLVAMIVGCTSRGGTVELQSQAGGKALSQTFSQAYFAQITPGEYDVVLVDNAAEWKYRKTGKNRPLEPVALSPIRQVMHIHLNWKPLTGVRKNPAATNATITWYVLGPDGTTDRIVYEGAGFVVLGGRGQNRSVSIREGVLEPKAKQGQLEDPIGVAKINGDAGVRMNRTRVEEIVAEMKQVGEGK